MPRSVITGIGKMLGSNNMSNACVAKKIEDAGGATTSDEWIIERTGIQSRFIANDSSTGQMAIDASKKALEMARLSAEQIDLIILATVTPDYGGTPSTACMVQKALSAKSIPAFDINAACSGFVYGLSIADSLLKTRYKNILVIGSEKLSTLIDWSDRKVAPLPGDGAGAVILTRSDSMDFGIFDWELHSSGNNEALVIPAGGSLKPASMATINSKEHFLRMDGKEVFKFAVQACEEIITALMERNGLSSETIDHIFLHQANLRISNSVSDRLRMPDKKFFHSIQYYGNTSSASIPLGIARAEEIGLLKKGDNILLVGFGGGLTWGGCYLTWGL